MPVLLELIEFAALGDEEREIGGKKQLLALFYFKFAVGDLKQSFQRFTREELPVTV